MACNFYDVFGLHINTNNKYYVIELYKIPYYTDGSEHSHNIHPSNIQALNEHYDNFLFNYQTNEIASYKPIDIFIDGVWFTKNLMYKYLHLVERKITKHEILLKVMKVRYRRWNLIK